MTGQTRGGTKKVRQTQDKECGYNELKACAGLVCERAWVSPGQCPGQSAGRSGHGVSGWLQARLWVGRHPLAPGLGSAWGPGVDH